MQPRVTQKIDEIRKLGVTYWNGKKTPDKD